MDPISLIIVAINYLASIPSVGPVIVKIIAYAAVLVGGSTAVVAFWHAVIAFLTALSTLPGLSRLSGVASKLQNADNAAEGVFNSYILPFLKQLSALPTPKAKA